MPEVSPKYEQQTLWDIPKRISSLEADFGHSRCDKPDGQTNGQCGQEVAHAQVFPPRAKDKGLQTLVTSGLIGCDSSASATLQSFLESKCVRRLDTAGSTLFNLTWKRKRTPLGRFVFGACSVGAPHIRQRLYFVADAESGRLGMRGSAPGQAGYTAQPSELGGVGDTGRTGLPDSQPEKFCGAWRRQKGRTATEPSETASGLADTSGRQLSFAVGQPDRRNGIGSDGADNSGVSQRPGPLNGFWRDADWIGCRDGKFRPVEPKYVWMVDEHTAPMGSVCDAGSSNAEAEKEKVNASEAQIRPDQKLPLLRRTPSSQALDERRVGKHNEFSPATLLQPEVHGTGLRRNDQGAQRQKQPAAIGQGGKENLRAVWEDKLQIARTPQRQRSDEQRAREFEEFVRLLPSSLALAEVRGDTATVEALRLLLKTSGAQGLVLHPSVPVETLWRSLTEKVQDRLWMDFEAGGFRRTIEFPLATGATARVGRLRLYGDAICVPAARAFIEAYLKIKSVKK